MELPEQGHTITRRQFASAAAAAAAGWLLTACGPRRLHEMSPARIKEALADLERRYSARYGKPMTVSNAPALPGVEFAYALDISRCIGCRRCVYACVEENNQSREPQVHWIRVFSMEKDKGVDFSAADPYYQPETVPQEGRFYVPVACQQCRKAPCTKVCPTGATWTEPDGIVVIDYDWCIGCRYCMAACPYGARHFNWSTPSIPKEQGVNFEHTNAYYQPDKVPEEGHFYVPVSCQQCEQPACTKVCPTKATWTEPDGIVVVDYDWCIGCRYCMAACPYGARHFNWRDPVIPAEALNPKMHVLGNRPRMKGVVEKCTFCIQRTREGRYPACVEVCPVGARKFGNLLDPAGELRYIIEHKRVLVLKEELNTLPKFFYFYGT